MDADLFFDYREMEEPEKTGEPFPIY